MTALSATTMTFGERFAYAGRMALIGMATVFSALAILWGALALFRLALNAIEKRKAGKMQAADIFTEPSEIPAPTAAPDEGAVIAAITAAISEVLAAENGGKTPAFRVVSYRRTRS